MSRFEPGSSINYEKMHENINIVRRRSAGSLFTQYLLITLGGEMAHEEWLVFITAAQKIL